MVATKVVARFMPHSFAPNKTFLIKPMTGPWASPTKPIAGCE